MGRARKPRKGGTDLEQLRGLLASGEKQLAAPNLNAARVTTWRSLTEDALMRVFGEDSPILTSFRTTRHLGSLFDATDEQIEEDRRANLVDSIEALKEIIGTTEAQHSEDDPVVSVDESSVKVFVVHGHDHGTKSEAARLVERLGLEAVVLDELPSKGDTIIEKIEANSDVTFAIVLMTGDDIGGKAGDPPDMLRPRARQNVILELGFFLAKLGRSHVCAVYEEGVEIPSDYSGVIFVTRDSSGHWRTQVAKEMQAAGLQVDLNKIP